MIDVDADDVFYRYKYLPFNEGSLKVITEGTVKFTCPLEFNDPFDCQPIYYIDKEVYEKNYFKLAEKLIMHLPPAKRLQEKNRKYEVLKRIVKTGEFHTELLKTVGVLSLSRTCNDILMWSHYADNHKGFVVGFHYTDFDSPSYDLGIANLLPHEVEYNDTRPVFNFAKSDSIMDCLMVKSKQWKYEQEERVFTTIEKPDVYKYDKQNRLYSVIAGAKITTENLKILKNAVKKASDELGKEIKFKQARLSSTSYKIEVDDKKI